MPLPRVKLVLGSDPRTTLVEVDGHDITKSIAGIQVGQVAGEFYSHVTLHLRGEVELESDVAEVVVEREAVTPAAALRELLNQVDPGELEQAAMSRMGGLDDGPSSTGQAFVAALQEWASE